MLFTIAVICRWFRVERRKGGLTNQWVLAYYDSKCVAVHGGMALPVMLASHPCFAIWQVCVPIGEAPEGHLPHGGGAWSARGAARAAHGV